MTRLVIFLLCIPFTWAHAEPAQYRLDTARSHVGFSYSFNGSERTGQMPVKSADMLIDLNNIPASTVSVVLDARAARAGFIIATQAMKAPEVLNTAQFPHIHFQSTRISGNLNGATVTGDLTVRGVTRPVALSARLYRQRGTDISDLSHLTILLTGAVSRSAFGAGGYATYVGDRITLRIVARIEK